MDPSPISLRMPRPEEGARVALGQRRMSRSRVVICGLARNVAKVLPSTIDRIESLGLAFADYRVVVYENDSTDGTVEALAEWASVNKRVKCLSERRGDPVNRPIRCLHRAARMAFYRNRYLDQIRSAYSDYDFAIVVDTDLAWGWSERGIASTFGHSHWDFVGSYGTLYRYKSGVYKQVHYDAWAYRVFGSDAAISTKEANRLTPGPTDTLMPVYSCFGGLGVYRMESMLTSRYSGEDCEHVMLHRRMRNAGHKRLYMNSEQTTNYGLRQRSIVRRWHKVRSGLMSMTRKTLRQAA